MREFGRLPLLLAISGFLSAVALAFPVLIVIGLFAFLIPGLVLAFSPTAFCNLSLFSLGWYSTKRFGRAAGTVAGLAIVGTIAIIPAKLANIQAAKAIAQVQSTSLQPASPISAPDHVTVLQPSYGQRYKNINSNETDCDDLCLALLYGGTAKSVTMGTSQWSDNYAHRRGQLPPVTYTISREKGCRSEPVIEPRRWSGWKDDETMGRLLFAVRLRIANGDCLVARPSTSADAGIRLTFLETAMHGPDRMSAYDRANPKIRTLEIRDSGRLIARSVDVEATEFAIPAWLSPDDRGLEISGWSPARHPYLAADPIDSVARLRALTGWPIDFPTTGIKGSSH